MKYRVECLSCWRKYSVVGIRPRYCAECGAELTEGCLVEEPELTRSWLERQPYDVPEGTPNLNEITDARELNELTGIGFVRAWNIIEYRKREGCRYERPVDVLAVRNVGVGVAAKLIGKVEFG